MLPIRNYFLDTYLMDIMIDDFVNERLYELSGENSDTSEEPTENQEDDPDYEPDGETMDDTEETNNVELEPSPPGDHSVSVTVQNDQLSVVATASAESENKSGSLACKPIYVSEGSSEDDGQCCTICLEPWTTTSEHRLVALRCGHLFGRSCITRWLKGHNTRCPQCNSRARRSEIRNIYARTIKVLDSSERDKVLVELEKERELRRKAEGNAAQVRLNHMMAVQECERLKLELMKAKKNVDKLRPRAPFESCFDQSSPTFNLVHTIELVKNGGCRLIDSSDMFGTILASQPSSNPLFRGYGFRKIATNEMKLSDFVLIHQNPIRDMVIHPSDALVLTASQDKTLKITNFLSNSVVQTYKVNSEVWSCAWDVDNPLYFYGGLRTGEVLVYDIRMTNTHVDELAKHTVKTPVVALQYLQQTPPDPNSRSANGPVVGKLTECFFLQKDNTCSTGHRIIPLQAPGPVFSLSIMSSGHCLVSCRPSTNIAQVTHTLYDFVLSETDVLRGIPLKTFIGGRFQSHLTRTKLFSHPEKESSLLVCAGDEDSRGILVWDGSSGDCISNMKTGGSIFDFCGVHVHSKDYMIAALDSSLQLFSWFG